MRRFSKAALFCLGFSMFALTAAAAAETEEEKLLKVDRAFAAAASEGRDADRIVSFWSDDATVYPPGGPVASGKAAIRAFVEKCLSTPGFHITWRSDRASVSADGTLAYTMKTNEITVSGADGKLVTIPGRGIAVWKRLPGGEWKCVVDIWNSGAP